MRRTQPAVAETEEEGKRTQTKESRKLLEAGKVKKTNSPIELPERSVALLKVRNSAVV